jgi:hypothetical protein
MRSRRPFVELCAQIRATPALFRGLGRSTELTLSVTWPELEHETFVIVTVDRCAQRLGGVRHWFLCPLCSSRRGLLISPGPAESFACCQCWRACHLCSYPTRFAMAVVLGRVPRPFADLYGDLARRRRGVRRPRGVRRRAARLVERMGLATLLRRLSWEETRDPAISRRSRSSTSCEDLSTAQSSRCGGSGTFPDARTRRPPAAPKMPAQFVSRGSIH